MNLTKKNKNRLIELNHSILILSEEIKQRKLEFKELCDEEANLSWQLIKNKKSEKIINIVESLR